MAAIYKKEGTYFIRFTDSQGTLRIMELPKGREVLTREFEKRKKELLKFLKKSPKEYLL